MMCICLYMSRFYNRMIQIAYCFDDMPGGAVTPGVRTMGHDEEDGVL